MATPFDRSLSRYFEAYKVHDADGCAGAFASDAEFLHPWGTALIGRRAIRDAHIEWFEEGETDKRWTVGYWMSDGYKGNALIRFSAALPDGSRLQGATLAAMENIDGEWLIRVASLTLEPPAGDLS
jgi:ketosteroid isomerase-like protein